MKAAISPCLPHPSPFTNFCLDQARLGALVLSWKAVRQDMVQRDPLGSGVPNPHPSLAPWQLCDLGQGMLMSLPWCPKCFFCLFLFLVNG